MSKELRILTPKGYIYTITRSRYDELFNKWIDSNISTLDSMYELILKFTRENAYYTPTKEEFFSFTFQHSLIYLDE